MIVNMNDYCYEWLLMGMILDMNDSWYEWLLLWMIIDMNDIIWITKLFIFENKFEN